MKKIFYKLAIAICAIILSISFVSCNKDEPNKNNPQQTEDTRYYVKYEIDMPSKWTNTVKKIKYVSEAGEKTFSTENKSWEATFGPLKKGDRLYLIIESQNQNEYDYVQSYNKARLYVSREKEPFVIKAESEGRCDLSLKYTIDF